MIAIKKIADIAAYKIVYVWFFYMRYDVITDLYNSILQVFVLQLFSLRIQ